MGKVEKLDDHRPRQVNSDAAEKAFQTVMTIIDDLPHVEAIDVLARALAAIADINGHGLEVELAMFKAMAKWRAAQIHAASSRPPPPFDKPL
jgi:hypothetical protein